MLRKALALVLIASVSMVAGVGCGGSAPKEVTPQFKDTLPKDRPEVKPQVPGVGAPKKVGPSPV
jgi:hypothetical protein